MAAKLLFTSENERLEMGEGERELDSRDRPLEGGACKRFDLILLQVQRPAKQNQQSSKGGGTVCAHLERATHPIVPENVAPAREVISLSTRSTTLRENHKSKTGTQTRMGGDIRGNPHLHLVASNVAPAMDVI